MSGGSLSIGGGLSSSMGRDSLSFVGGGLLSSMGSHHYTTIYHKMKVIAWRAVCISLQVL